MQINYYPETHKIRLRAPIFRDDEVREAAINVAKKICTASEIKFNEKTSSVLVIYEKNSLDMEKLNSLIPLARKLRSKVLSYTSAKKDEVLKIISEIENKISTSHNQ